MKHLRISALFIWFFFYLLPLDYNGNAFALDLPAYIPMSYDDSEYPADSSLRYIPDIRNSVVRIYAGNENPDHHDKQGKAPFKRVNGSGCIIKSNMILTSAHVVAKQEFIQVRKYSETKKYTAHLRYISHDYDVALLTVDDNNFFADVAPIDLGGLPDGRQRVSVYGFPGSEELIVTQGLFSKIENIKCAFSGKMFPAGKLQASVKPGNSGGPVIYDDKLIGVVIQVARKGDITVMVPSQIIIRFLHDISDSYHDVSWYKEAVLF